MKNLVTQNYDVVFKTDIATVGLQFDGRKLMRVDYLKNVPSKAAVNKQVETVKNKIINYLKPGSGVKSINVDIQLGVTPFQEKVLHQLRLIPYGETRTYGEIARTLKTSPRAVGNACRNNPVSIIIPCHRVVAAHGIGGYSGETEGELLTIKRRLLQLEGAIR